MNELLGRVFSFESEVFPGQAALYNQLVTDGQQPRALMISCADSRIVPEQIMQAKPGELFVCRNAGNIVPPFATQNGGVSSTVEYAVMALGVRDIIVCGHSDCGAMKGLSDPEAASRMPNVIAWLRHSHAASKVVDECYPEFEGEERVRALALENVVAQIHHLRTHPSVASGIARGEIALHGWFVDITAGVVLALDGQSGRFSQVAEGTPLPVAVPNQTRQAASRAAASVLEAAE